MSNETVEPAAPEAGTSTTPPAAVDAARPAEPLALSPERRGHGADQSPVRAAIDPRAAIHVIDPSLLPSAA